MAEINVNITNENSVDVSIDTDRMTQVIVNRPASLEVTVEKGAKGEGVPSGGIAGQFLIKQSSAPDDTAWQDPDYVQFDTTANATIAYGKLRWNTTANTLGFGIIDGTDECAIGQQMFAYVTNADAVTIQRGQPVYLYQATGNRASIKLASNLGDSTSAKTLGLAAQSIAANQTGFVITQGVLDKVNTSAFTEGATLYLGSTAGSLTSTKPVAPNHLVYIGVVERANAGNGQIYVKPQNGYELDEIHDVLITSPTTGQTLVYNASTDLWSNSNAPVLTGATINNSVIGDVTPNVGSFTTINIPGQSGVATLTKNTSITSWNYSGKNKSVNAEETIPTGLFISPDGLNMYVNGSTGDDVNQYVLSTAWDVTTASYVRVFSTAVQDSSPQDIFFSPDGLTMFVIGQTSKAVFQYTLTTAWNISTASYASKLFSVTTQEATPTGLWFSPTGTIMYIVGTTVDAVFQYTLTTAWDVSTASYANKTYSFAANEGSAQQVNLSANGLKMWVVGVVGDDIWEYSLATPWDITTASPVNNFYVGFQDTNPTGMFIDSTVSNRVYIVGSTNRIVYQYNTATNSVEFASDRFYVPGNLCVNNNFTAGLNAYVDGTLTVQGNTVIQGSTSLGTTNLTGSLTASSTLSLTGATTSATVLGTAATTGTTTIGGTSQTGTLTIGQSTVSQTINFQAGATTSGNTKTINFGTAGLSGSTTNIFIGSSVSGSLGTITLQSPTINFGQTAIQFSVVNTASAVNYIQATGATIGNSPQLSTLGSDASIDLALTPKGTGFIKFGTYTATVLSIAGYIEIKDSAGNIRKLAVVA